MINNNKVKLKSITMVGLALLLILSTVQILFIELPLIETVSAQSCWTQTTQPEFLGGQLTNLTVTDTGDVELKVRSGNIDDTYLNTSNLQAFNGLKIVASTNSIQLANKEIFYVSEGGSGRHGIVKATMDGTIFTTYGSYGTGVGQFKYPHGVAYDNATDHIYVADTYNHRIVKTKINGAGWTTYGVEGSGTNEFNQTKGIHLDDTTQFLYIGDVYNTRIVKTRFGGAGWTTYTNGSIFINDLHYDSSTGYIHCGSGTDHIFRSKIDGTSECKFGTMGSGVNQFQYPRGIYYDDGPKHVYVADMGNGRIVITKMDGSYWNTFGTTGSGVGQFDNPQDVYYDNSTGYFYILDGGNSRIVKTMIDGTGWQTLGGFMGAIKFCIDFDSGYLSNGFMTSKNLLEGVNASLLKSFNYSASLVPSGTILKVQFSQDAVNWYNSLGLYNGWESMTQGYNKSIDISPLKWSGNRFYYKIDFSGDGTKSPVLDDIKLEYLKHEPHGTLISTVHNAENKADWDIINWSSTEPLETSFAIETRSGNTSTPDSTWGEWMPQINGNAITNLPAQYIQYRATLTTGNSSLTPILHSISINYNFDKIPKAPILLSPQNDTYINNDQPIFDWAFIDLDFPVQDGFQVLIDDDSDFVHINFDSGLQTSSNSWWQFPEGTDYNIIPDGTWYWKCRTRNLKGLWGPYSNFWVLKIDTTPPNPFIPVADPDSWTSNTQPQISFSTTDETSGIDRYDLIIGGTTISNRSSPFTIPPQTDGIHAITVRAYDNAGNYIDGDVDIYIDTTPPNEFTPIAEPSNWTSDNQPEISFSTTDQTSGVDYYEVRIDDGDFLIQQSPYVLPALLDGIHIVTIRAYDMAGNYRDGTSTLYIDTSPPLEFIPTVEPSDWTTNQRPGVSFSTTDTTSGVDRYEIRIDEGDFSDQESTYVLPPQNDGIHTITVRAYDKAENYRDAVVDIYIDTTPPKIVHTPVTNGKEGMEIIINATVTDEYSGVGSVSLYYRCKNETIYSIILMESDGNNYSAAISSDEVTSDIEYYIEVLDSSSPRNVIYFGIDGETDIEPTSATDMDVLIEIGLKEEEKQEKEEESSLYILLIGIIIVIAVILILSLIFLRKKKKQEIAVPKSADQPEIPEYPAQPPQRQDWQYQSSEQPSQIPPQNTSIENHLDPDVKFQNKSQ